MLEGWKEVLSVICVIVFIFWASVVMMAMLLDMFMKGVL